MNNSQIINNVVNLRKLRESKNLTQLQLSIKLEVSQELISRYELGTSFPQPQMLIKLANFFNCSVDYLLGLTDIPTPTKYLVSTSNIESAELYSKYKSLSNEDKKYFDRFLSFLLDNSNKS